MKKSTSILQIGKYFPPAPGGMELMVKEIADSLSFNGYKSDIICFVKASKSIITKYKNGKLILLNEQLCIRSAPISIPYIKWIFQNLNSYDIIHIHLPNPLALIPFLFRSFRGKIIIHWHSDIVKQKLLYWFVMKMESYILRRADKIICTSSEYAKDSIPLKKWQKKLAIIPIGIEDPLKSTTSTKFKNRSETLFQNRELIFIGRLVPYKGVEYLIHSLSLLPTSFSLKIVGDGPLKEKLAQLTMELNLASRVQFLGNVDNQHKYKLIIESGLLVLPSISKNEAFGIVLLEAMALFTPVISTSIQGSATGSVNQSNATGFVVEKQNPRQLAQAIAKIFNSLDQYQDFCINARRRYEKEFKASTTYKKIENLYNQVLLGASDAY